MENFSSRLKAIRQAANETQRQAANGIGISEKIYQVYESGSSLPGYKKLVAIAEHFDVSLDYLMCRIDIDKKRGDKNDGISRTTENKRNRL